MTYMKYILNAWPSCESRRGHHFSVWGVVCCRLFVCLCVSVCAVRCEWSSVCDELRCACNFQTETYGINRNQNHMRNQSHSPQQQSLIRRRLIKRRVHTTPTAIFAFHDSQAVMRHDIYITINKWYKIALKFNNKFRHEEWVNEFGVVYL